MAYVKVTRTLTYIGPEEWVRTTKARSFVTLARELGTDRVILSHWDLPPVEVTQDEVEQARQKALTYQASQTKSSALEEALNGVTDGKGRG